MMLFLRNETFVVYYIFLYSIMKNGYDGSTPLQIERPVYQIEELNRDHLYEKPYTTSKYHKYIIV